MGENGTQAGMVSQAPAVVRWTIYAIKEVGVPVVALVMMFYLVNYGNERMTASVEKNTGALLEFAASTRLFWAEVQAAHKSAQEALTRIEGAVIRRVPN